MNDRGTFGDMFGVVNALFSGLAFAGVIYAILLQRKELELQRRELELTRGELARSADAQNKSSSVLDEQLRIMKKNYSFEREKELSKAQPIISLSGGSIRPGAINGNFINSGAVVREVKAIPLDDCKISIPKIWQKNISLPLSIIYNSSANLKSLKFDIEFLDALGMRRIKHFEYSLVESALIDLHPSEIIQYTSTSYK